MIIVIELNINRMISRWPDLAHVHLPGKHAGLPGVREGTQSNIHALSQREDCTCRRRRMLRAIQVVPDRGESNLVEIGNRYCESLLFRNLRFLGYSRLW